MVMVPSFVSGRPSLDLLGTLKWRRDASEELLTTATDLRTWFASSDLALDEVEVVPGDVERVRVVREALYRTFGAVRLSERLSRSDTALLNDVAAGAGPSLTLTANGTVQQTATVQQALTAIVHDAFGLLHGDDAAGIRDCGNPRCTRLFLDTSRGASRRWCGMAECGNAAKVAAYRARHRR